MLASYILCSLYVLLQNLSNATTATTIITTATTLCTPTTKLLVCLLMYGILIYCMHAEASWPTPGK